MVIAARRRRFFDWLAVLGWMGLIFWLSATPDLKSGLVAGWDLVLRKIAHVIEYAILGWLVVRALGPGQRFTIARTALVFCILYAISDEWHQTFVPGRKGSVIDVLVDSFGATLGILVFIRRR